MGALLLVGTPSGLVKTCAVVAAGSGGGTGRGRLEVCQDVQDDDLCPRAARRRPGPVPARSPGPPPPLPPLRKRGCLTRGDWSRSPPPFRTRLRPRPPLAWTVTGWPTVSSWQ